MRLTRKFTVFVALIMPVILIAGYFCVMPNMAIAAAAPITSAMADCSDMTSVNHIFISSAPANNLMPCCLEKTDNTQTAALNFNIFSLNNANSQLTTASLINDSIFDNNAVLYDYPISPTELTSPNTTIKKE